MNGASAGDQAVAHRGLPVAHGHCDLGRAAADFDLRNRIAVRHSHHVRCRGRIRRRDAYAQQPQNADRHSGGADGTGRNDDPLHIPTYVIDLRLCVPNAETGQRYRAHSTPFPSVGEREAPASLDRFGTAVSTGIPSRSARGLSASRSVRGTDRPRTGRTGCRSCSAARQYPP
jgi:hypothetical protein